MLNTLSSASVEQRLWQKKWFWYNKINSLKHVCHCGAVGKELLGRADELGSTPGDTVFCFFVRIFSV